jgi:hypothetical protein
MVNSGIVTDKTQIVYRSYSGNQSILIEVTREQMDIDTQGELMFEKIIKFLRVFFLRNIFF